MASTSFGKNFSYFLLAFFTIAIGLYPVMFLFIPEGEGLLSSKPNSLLQSTAYLLGFYTHIFMGGLALLTGFSQFFPRLRRNKLGLHRKLGALYVIAVLLSGVAALSISYFATGGLVPALGFGMLAMLWLFTTYKAYSRIKQRDINAHQRWMIRSYALCFAAVTLRIYLPLFLGALQMEFNSAYSIIAWLCWVPNLFFAEFILVRRLPHYTGLFS